MQTTESGTPLSEFDAEVLAKTLAICVVAHGLPKRHELLVGDPSPADHEILGILSHQVAQTRRIAESLQLAMFFQLEERSAASVANAERKDAIERPGQTHG